MRIQPDKPGKLRYFLAGAPMTALAAVLVWVLANPSPTRPNAIALRDGVLAMAALEVSPSALTGRAPDGAVDAGECLDRAVRLVRAGTVDAAARQEAAELIGQAARQTRMDYVWRFTPQAVEVGGMMRDVQGDLQAVLNAVLAHCRAQVDRREFAAAENTLLDLLTVGHLLSQEHKRVWTDLIGLSFQRQACRVLADLYRVHWPQDEARLAAVAAYAEAVERADRHYQDKARFLRNDRSLGQSPGDVFAIATADANPAWRVEAVAALGMVKFKATGRGDQRHIRTLIDRARRSENPIESAAAAAADEMTAEQYRTLPSRQMGG